MNSIIEAQQEYWLNDPAPFTSSGFQQDIQDDWDLKLKWEQRLIKFMRYPKMLEKMDRHKSEIGLTFSKK